jgi:ribosomal protein S18 acetylase RimI-like enzyme
MSLEEVFPGENNLLLKLEFIRQVRNTVREFMTNNTDMITESDQIAWYNSINHEKLRLFVYFSNGRMAGYGIINTTQTPFPLLTGAISQKYQGRGHGRKLFESLLEICKTDYSFVPELDVRSTNVKAINLYESLGFIKTVQDKEIISMIYRGGEPK